MQKMQSGTLALEPDADGPRLLWPGAGVANQTYRMRTNTNSVALLENTANCQPVALAGIFIGSCQAARRRCNPVIGSLKPTSHSRVGFVLFSQSTALVLRGSFSSISKAQRVPQHASASSKCSGGPFVAAEAIHFPF